MFKRMALSAAFLTAACGHTVSSEQCQTSLCSQQTENAYQIYSLPVTMVELNFTAPESGTPSLAVAPRNVPDANPTYRYQLNYHPHFAADDHLTFTVRGGLLNTTDVQSTTQLPDLASVTQSATQLVMQTMSDERVTPAPQDPDIFSRAPNDTFSYRPFSRSALCTVQSIVQRTCRVHVADHIRLVRLSCTRANRDYLNIVRVRETLGDVRLKTDCSSATQDERVFSFEVVDARVYLRANILDTHRAFWTAASTPGTMPSGTNAIYYRTTAPIQLSSSLCRENIRFGAAAASGATDCNELLPNELPFLGATHQFQAVVESTAYALPMERNFGPDHRKYVFSEGVLETVEIERTGPLLGIIRLPLTVLGVGTD